MAVASTLGVSSRTCLASYRRPNAVAAVTRPISKLRVAPVVAFSKSTRREGGGLFARGMTPCTYAMWRSFSEVALLSDC